MSVISSFEEPFWRVVLWSARKIIEFVFFGKCAAAEVDQGRLEIRRNDEDVLELDVAVEDCAVLAVLDTVDDLEHNLSKKKG